MTMSQTSWTGWAMNSVKSPLIWSLSKLKEVLTEIDVNEIQYIYIGYLKVIYFFFFLIYLRKRIKKLYNFS